MRKASNAKLFPSREAYLLANEIRVPGATMAATCAFCTDLEESFSNGKTLLAHFWDTHYTFRKMYICDFCPIRDSHIGHLRQHRRVEHNARGRYDPVMVHIHAFDCDEERLLGTLPSNVVVPFGPMGGLKAQHLDYTRDGGVPKPLLGNHLPQVS